MASESPSNPMYASEGGGLDLYYYKYQYPR